jgi:hypothetical protein
LAGTGKGNRQDIIIVRIVSRRLRFPYAHARFEPPSAPAPTAVRRIAAVRLARSGQPRRLGFLAARCHQQLHAKLASVASNLQRLWELDPA